MNATEKEISLAFSTIAKRPRPGGRKWSDDQIREFQRRIDNGELSALAEEIKRQPASIKVLVKRRIRGLK